MNNRVELRVVSCDWGKICYANKSADIHPSRSNKYPHAEGWFQVDNIHDGVLTLYLKKARDELTIIWYRPLTQYQISGVGSAGK